MAGLPLKKLSCDLGGEFFSICPSFAGFCFGRRLLSDGYSVLIVDDEPGMLETMSDILDSTGYRATALPKLPSDPSAAYSGQVRGMP